MTIEQADDHSRILAIATIWLTLGLAAGRALASSEEDATALPPEPATITYSDDIQIKKVFPIFSLHDPTITPGGRGAFIAIENGNLVRFGYNIPGQGSGPMFDFGIDAQSFDFWHPVSFYQNVGIGGFPTASLHVRGGLGQTRLLVEEQSSEVIGRNLIQLVNNGPSTFRFENRASGTIWGFGSIAAQDKFFIAKVGATGLDLTLDGDGNLTILGTLSQLSDRNAKRDIEPVDRQGLLEAVAGLPLSTWSYKADAPGVRHIGPMAQDFAESFGLGADRTHVAPSDVAGVSLAAVQALKRENDELRTALERTTRELYRRLEALEAQAGAN